MIPATAGAPTNPGEPPRFPPEPGPAATPLGLAVVLALGILGWPAGGTAWAQEPASPEPGSELTVYLVTMGPGDEVWERFGHNALWIRDHEAGTDRAYNWGVFDFEDEDFLLGFLQGDMEYWVESAPMAWTVEGYRQRNRSVRVQELNLAPSQRVELQEFAEWNVLPENRYYAYDYFRDNCSTRVRDALDGVLGGAIRERFGDVPAEVSYRWHARRLVQHDPVIDTGMHILMSGRGDRPITVWEEMFLPMEMERALREMTVPGPDGEAVPLVVGEDTLFQAQRPPEPAETPPFRGTLFAVGLFVGVVFPMMGIRAGGGSGRARLGFALLGAGWGIFAAFFGSIMLLAWTWTDHVFIHGNENLFQMNPLSLAVAGLVPLYLGAGRLRRATLAVASAVAALALLGFVLQLHPGFVQVNGDVIALALPAHLGLVWGLLRIDEGRTLVAGAAASERARALGAAEQEPEPEPRFPAADAR